jgi:hypothetical protein
MDQSTLGQLDVIREISDALTCAAIDHWLLAGGPSISLSGT